MATLSVNPSWIPFPIRICPLCSKKLKVRQEGIEYTFYCEEFYLRPPTDKDGMEFLFLFDEQVEGNNIKVPHYSVEYAKAVTQTTVVPPFTVVSLGGSGRTQIYKFPIRYYDPVEKNLIMDIPVISPFDYLADDFAKKIKNLVIFS